MCDYSLYSNSNRLAEDGEELVLHRFETGTIGFAAVDELCEFNAAVKAREESLWQTIKSWLSPRRPQVTAVCIPPGARLWLSDVPKKVQASLCVSSCESVVFTELSSRAYSYRDAFLLPNGTRVLLQDLPAGIHAIVLSTSSDSSEKPAGTEAYVA